jgi:thiosulfate dehydrogenase (quinone) large subunit
MRLALGWFYIYAGVTKILDPNWDASFYLKGAKIGAGFYSMLLSPGVLPIVNFVNAWGLTLLGISLVLGLLVRYSAPLGMVLMALYYIPLGIIHPDAHSFIVDDHIIYITALFVLFANNAGRYWGIDGARQKSR